jgi:methionyl-tRNA synthetase
MNMARAGNKYLADNEPWKTVKTDADHTATIMYHAIQVCAHLSWWMSPFIPYSASKLCGILNFNKDKYTFGNFEQVPVKHQLGEAIHLFSNIEDDTIQVQLDKLLATKNAIAHAEAINTLEKKEIESTKASIQFDDFSKMDLRVGTILSAEKVKKADKLLMLQVDLGFETRTIVSGIALDFEPETLVGKQVCVLANLEARTIKGIESKGMILMAEDADGKLHLMSPENLISAGSKIS